MCTREISARLLNRIMYRRQIGCTLHKTKFVREILFLASVTFHIYFYSMNGPNVYPAWGCSSSFEVNHFFFQAFIEWEIIRVWWNIRVTWYLYFLTVMSDFVLFRKFAQSSQICGKPRWSDCKYLLIYMAEGWFSFCLSMKVRSNSSNTSVLTVSSRVPWTLD